MTPTAERLRWIRQLACRAYWTSLEGRPGPVHLNFPLPEPLVLSEELPEDSSGRPGRLAVGQPFREPTRSTHRRATAISRPTGSGRRRPP